MTAHMPAAWKRSPLVGILMVVLGALCFSLAIIFIRAADGLDVMTPGFYRCLFAFLFYSLLVMAGAREPLAYDRYQPSIPLLVGLGVAIAITTSLYTYAIQTTTAANTTLLINTAPLYVALFTPRFLGEARPRYTAVSLALAAGGILLMTGPANLRISGAEMLGIGAAALSGLTYAMPLLIGRQLAGRVGGVTQGWWSMGIAAVLLLPLAFRSTPAATAANLPYMVALGVVSMGIAYLLIFNGLRLVSAQVASIAALFEPVGGMLIGLLVYQEYLSVLGVAGSLFVLASIYLISR